MKDILLECDLNNINYTDSYNSNFWLNNMITVTDDDGYVCETLSYAYDNCEYSYAPVIPIGSKAKLFVSYKVHSDAAEVTINFYNQYILTTNIE